MSILKSGRPSSKKDKAIASVQDIEQKLAILHVNLPKSFHKKLKQRALDEDTTISDIVIKALNVYMAK